MGLEDEGPRSYTIQETAGPAQRGKSECRGRAVEVGQVGSNRNSTRNGGK